MSVNEEVLKSVAAATFLEAKLKEFEASCLFGDAGRVAAVEEDCRSALQGLLDAKAALAKAHIREARRNNR